MTERVELPTMTIAGWQREAADPRAALDRLRDHVLREEPRIHALVAEKDRFARLKRETESVSWGSLQKVLVGVKDIFHVDGFETRAGSRLPPAELQGPEAECVTALKEAGALILGKTVSTEFAYFAPGPTRNPHDPRHTPGGSSSGSAAAVAAGYCPLALGTQTIGSISRPASFCGVVGFKPTFDRISTAGVFPLAPSLDHVGLFTTTAGDASTAAAVLCPDWASPRVERRPALGIPEGPYLERATAAGLGHFRRVCQGLQSAGWDLRSIPAFDDFDEIEATHQTILAAEVARLHSDLFARFGELYHPKTRELIERGRDISDSELAKALPARARLRDRLQELMERQGIELWLSPAATGPAPVGIESTGDPVMNLPWTQAGLPTVSLPAGVESNGLPMGLQVTGHWQGDESLLAWCLDLERSLESPS